MNWFWLVLFLMLAGCKAHEINVDGTTNVDSAAVDKQMAADSLIVVNFKELSLADSSQINVDMSWWSSPDSCGTQHKLKSANIKIQRKIHVGHRARDSLQRLTSNFSVRQMSKKTTHEKHRHELVTPTRNNAGLLLLFGVMLVMGAILIIKER